MEAQLCAPSRRCSAAKHGHRKQRLWRDYASFPGRQYNAFNRKKKVAAKQIAQQPAIETGTIHKAYKKNQSGLSPVLVLPFAFSASQPYFESRI